MASVKEFCRDQNVFITGASGFIGKVLLEKLLRSCNIANAYILIRPRKGKEASERVKEMINLPIFDVLKEKCPENLKKIIPIEGDCTKLGLGISPNDLQELQEKVSIVFHSAASIRFNDTLTNATLMNARGTRDMMLIIKNMKKLKVFVHVSTAYSNCDKKVIEEKLYPPHSDWRKIINMVETIDEHTLNILTPKIIGDIPNTYIFSKSLAEHIVKDLGENLPVVIFRPSVVISSLNDPFPGWIDNFNGPIGLMTGGGKGIVRVSYANPDAIVDYMPVDIAVKGLIGAAWSKALSGDVSEPTIYNAASGSKRRVSMKTLVDSGLQIVEDVPLDNMLWRPYGTVTNNKYNYFIRVILLHLLPAIIIDGILRLLGKKPLLVKIQARIYSASIAVFHFLNNTWHFKNDNLIALRESMHPDDAEEFDAENVESSDDLEYLKKAAMGARLYLLKEKPENIPQAKKHYRRLVWLDRIVFGLIYIVLVYYIYSSGYIQRSLHSLYTAVTFK